MTGLAATTTTMINSENREVRTNTRHSQRDLISTGSSMQTMPAIIFLSREELTEGLTVIATELPRQKGTRQSNLKDRSHIQHPGSEHD
jgi:hypothetical protein